MWLSLIHMFAEYLEEEKNIISEIHNGDYFLLRKKRHVISSLTLTGNLQLKWSLPKERSAK